jgi:hypothetical protein
MTDEPRKFTIDQKIAFAVSPDGQGDGVPILIVGVTAGTWEYMKDGNTHNLDLTKIGVPAKFVFFDGESHDAVMKVLQQGCADRGEAYLDDRRRGFSIQPAKPAPDKTSGKITRDPDYPVEYAQLFQAFNSCAEGHGSDAVLNAGLQMVAAAIGTVAKSKGCSLEDAEAYTEHVVGALLKIVRDNWQRAAKSSDVAVRPS